MTKLIIFTKYARMAEIIARELSFLKETNIYLITGKTPLRTKILSDFKDSSKDTILIATDCLSQGQNLQEASIIIHFDLPWTPASLEQRNGRIDRIGQTQKLRIINLVTENTFEERVLNIINEKSDYINKVVNFKDFLSKILKK